MSADLYPNLVLERGNLIVVPRANFKSIIHYSRGVNGDMNRRFDHDAPEDIDDEIVEIIKGLMAQADIFLNLHDGWGFYRPEYVDKMHNPHRFGQSIIADASIYATDGDTIALAQMAHQVIERMNRKISVDEHKYHFMNTQTHDPETEFPEQAKSATYFALTNYGIPAFGIESSKNLSTLEMKIRYHNYAINEFLALMNIEPEHPAILYEPPHLIYMLISINDGHPQMIDEGKSIQVTPGDAIKVTHIESNYPRGLSCDVRGLGTENDFDCTIRVYSPTSIIARKDNTTIGTINVTVEPVNYELMTYIFEVNGQRKSVLDNQKLKVHRGDKIKIVDVVFENASGSEFEVNLKGFVPPTDYNSGEDRNFVIDTSQLTWNKYSVNGRGILWPIVVSKGDYEVSRAFIELE
ncbi:MAG: hypothetical protein MAGBODY4_01218 [Candidatus Marinimicrobia bacterium]|nr:hypothetical protein [Candidatus Neomarinimicrobiota bacterium]